MKTRNGQVAWLSANTNRVFLSYDKAIEDAKQFIYAFCNNEGNAYNDVYLIHLWLNEE